MTGHHADFAMDVARVVGLIFHDAIRLGIGGRFWRLATSAKCQTNEREKDEATQKHRAMSILPRVNQAMHLHGKG